MKKFLLLIGTTLVLTSGLFSQAGAPRLQPSGVLDINAVRNQHYNFVSESKYAGWQQGNVPVSQVQLQSAKPAAITSTVSWQLLCGSMNVNGMRISQSRPLQYHSDLNAISFVHRKSTSYQTSPPAPATAESGVVVAEISTNWGQSFDSTAMWMNATQWGRYPQGAIYNPPGNTNLSNAYIVGSGATVSGSAFTGVWYASKKLNAFDNVPDAASGAEQFLSFTLPSYPPNLAPHSWSSYGFSSTSDGVVRSLALICDNNTTSATMRGVAVATGSYNAGTFSWRIDSIIPPCATKTDLTRYISGSPQMVWNPAGTIGYVVINGVLGTATLANMGFQPMVYKMDRTVNANATWSLTNGIDFNNVSMKPVLDHLAPVNPTSTLAIPFVDDYNLAIDANDKLHIGVVFMSTASDHPDSLNFIAQFTTSINPTEKYKWAHVNGNRPYLYDFIGDGSSLWKFVLIDSISSEGPSSVTGNPGFNDNPWDNGGELGRKVEMDSRIQLGRTPDGKFITFSWAESDSGFTNNAYKWNNLPDIKTRLMEIGSGLNMYRLNVGSEQNITASDNNVRTRATLHYMSSVTGAALINPGLYGTFTVEINTPFTVTNSNPYSQTTNNSTWYGKTRLAYAFAPLIGDGLNDQNQSTLLESYLYPNPAASSVILSTTLKNDAQLQITILNSTGQEIRTIQRKASEGENKIQLEIKNLPGGIYFINVKAGNSTSTKKLVIE